MIIFPFSIRGPRERYGSTILLRRAIPPRRQSLAHRRSRLPRRLHGSPRHQHRQRRPSPHRRRSRRQQRRKHLGAHFLSRFQRHHSSHQRLVRRRPRTQTLLHDLHHHLYADFPALRRRSQPRSSAVRPCHSRRRRRRPPAHGPSHSRRHFSPGKTWPRLFPLRAYRDRRSRHRPHARRLDHRQLFLALDFLHQSSRRHFRSVSRAAPHPRPVLHHRQKRQIPPRGLYRLRPSRRRRRRSANPPRQRPGGRLVRLPLHRDINHHRRCLFNRARDLRVASEGAHRGRAPLRQQKFRHRWLGHVRGRRRVLRLHRPHAAISTDAPRLHRGKSRHRALRRRRCAPLGAAHRRPAHHQDSGPLPDRLRLARAIRRHVHLHATHRSPARLRLRHLAAHHAIRSAGLHFRPSLDNRLFWYPRGKKQRRRRPRQLRPQHRQQRRHVLRHHHHRPPLPIPSGKLDRTRLAAQS